MAAAALATVFLGALTTTASSAGLCAEGILLQPGLDLTLTKYKYLSRGWLDATFRKDSATLCVGSTSKERTENRYQWIGGFAQEGYGTRCVSGAPSSFTSSATSPPANSVAATIKLSTDISTIQAGTGRY
jgi:hypothetical protein